MKHVAGRRALRRGIALPLSAGLALLALPAGPASASSVDVATVDVGGSPQSVAVSPDGSHVYVATNLKVAVVDATTNTALTPISPTYAPTRVAVSPDGSVVYSTAQNDEALMLSNAQTGTTIKSITLDRFATPLAVVASPNGQRVYTGDFGTHSVTVVDALSQSKLTTIALGQSEYPRGLAISPDSSRLYVADDGSDAIAEIDTTTNTVLGLFPVGDRPFAVAVSPDGGRLYTANFGSRTVSVVDTSSKNVVATIPVGSMVRAVEVSPDGSRVFAANEGDNTVSVIDTKTNTVVETIATGDGPYALAMSPDGSRLYVANADAATISVVAFTPSKPTGVAATAGNAEVSATWTAPEYTGGQPITGYTATANPGGQTCQTAATTCTIKGLSNGTLYTVTVKATNSAGSSEASEPSNAVTPSAPSPVPGKATKLKAKATTSRVKTSWKAAPGATKYAVKMTGKNPKNRKVVKKMTTVKTRAVLKMKLRKRSQVKICVTPWNNSGAAKQICSVAKVK